FFLFSESFKVDCLCCAQVLRNRDALPVANRYLKEAAERKDVDPALLEMSLKLFIKTTIAGSGQTQARLQRIIQNGNLSEKNTVLAIKALAAVEMDPTD